MKRLILLPLLISISFLNMGFMFKKTEIKGIVCGEEEFFTFLKKNFYQKNIYKQTKELSDLENSQGKYLMGWFWFFDAKTGQLYEYEKYTDSLKPFYETQSTNKKKSIFTYQGSIEKNKLVITFITLLANREPDPDSKPDQEVFYFDENVYRSEYDGKKYEDKCEYFPIPKGVKINY